MEDAQHSEQCLGSDEQYCGLITKEEPNRWILYAYQVVYKTHLYVNLPPGGMKALPAQGMRRRSSLASTIATMRALISWYFLYHSALSEMVMRALGLHRNVSFLGNFLRRQSVLMCCLRYSPTATDRYEIHTAHISDGFFGPSKGGTLHRVGISIAKDNLSSLTISIFHRNGGNLNLHRTNPSNTFQM